MQTECSFNRSFKLGSDCTNTNGDGNVDSMQFTHFALSSPIQLDRYDDGKFNLNSLLLSLYKLFARRHVMLILLNG